VSKQVSIKSRGYLGECAQVTAKERQADDEAGGRCGRTLAEFQYSRVQHGPLVQRCVQRPVQAIFEVKLAAPSDHMEGTDLREMYRRRAVR
jgi:hypothetical protein